MFLFGQGPKGDAGPKGDSGTNGEPVSLSNSISFVLGHQNDYSGPLFLGGQTRTYVFLKSFLEITQG